MVGVLAACCNHTHLPGLGCVFLSMWSREERLLLQAEDFRAPVLSGRICENAFTHRGLGGSGEVGAGGTAECGRHCKRPAPVPSTLHSHPTQLLPLPAPSPALAAWSQSEPGQPEVPYSAPSEQPHPRPHGSINSAGSGLSDGATQIHVLHQHRPQNFLCGWKRPTSVVGNVAATSRLWPLSSYTVASKTEELSVQF